MTRTDVETEFAATVSDLVLRGQLAVFVGAGISVEAGGVLVLDFLEQLLESLKIVEADSTRVLNGLPFEAVLQELASEVDIQPLLALFDLREPTAIHLLLARLARKGLLHTIATTNFDQLLELALDDEGMERGSGYAVYHEERSLAAVTVQSGIPKVIKLHGSVEDPLSVAITLSRVTSRTPSAQRQPAIDYLFRTGPHAAVLVAGYSCSDVFDLTPQIIANAGDHEKKKILLIEHHVDADSSPASAEPVSQRDSKNPFKGFGGIRIYTDTGHIMRLVWQTLFADEMPPTFCRSVKWREVLADYLSSTQAADEPKCSLIAGRILFAIGELDAAELRFRRALQIANRRGDNRTAARAAANARACCVGLGEYKSATALYNAGMDLALAAWDMNSYRDIRMQLANVHHSRGHYDEALQLLYEALHEVEDRGDRRLAMACIGNIAGVLHDQGRFDKALELSYRQLELAKDLGDKTSETYALHRLGLIHRNLGNVPDAIKCHSEGVEVSRLIGDRVMQGKHLGELGVCSHVQGRYTDAVEHNMEALHLARETGDRRAEAGGLANLGRHHRASGRYEAALEALQAAVAIAREIGDQQGESSAVGSLGLLYEDMGNLDEGYRYQEEALRITRKIGNQIGTIAHLTNLARLSICRRQVDLAREFLLEAVQILNNVHGPNDLRTRETANSLVRLNEVDI